jgi:hypothetical protein
VIFPGALLGSSRESFHSVLSVGERVMPRF